MLTALYRQDLLQMESELMTLNTLDDQHKSIAYINKLSVQIFYDFDILLHIPLKRCNLSYSNVRSNCVKYHSSDTVFVRKTTTHIV